jgi:membrane-bound lytic murein transglycosylase MltF
MYKDVEEVTIKKVDNGVIVYFLGRYNDGEFKKFTMVYPDLSVALDMIEEFYGSPK